MFPSVIKDTVNPRMAPWGLIYFCCFLGGFAGFWMGLIRGGLTRGGLIKLFDKCRIKSSLPKLLFSVLVQEQSIFKH